MLEFIQLTFFTAKKLYALCSNLVRIELTLTMEERKVLTEKLMDLANLLFGALTLTQAFAKESFNLPLAMIGLAFWIIIYIYALKLILQERK